MHRESVLAKIIGVNVMLAFLAACGFSVADENPKDESHRIIGELKAHKNTPDGKNTIIDVLAPGEEKARHYYVLYDPKINGPIASVLAAVRAAKVGAVVELEWVKTGHGPAIRSFRVFKKGPGEASAHVDKKVDDLLKERLAILKELVTLTRSAYMAGTGTFADLRKANVSLLRAELELCESEKERIAVHEKAVASARDAERVAAQLHKSGSGTQAALLAARAERLDAEIALERARAKTAAHPK